MERLHKFQTEVDQVRSHCGYFLLEDWCIISTRGKETFSFLQTQTTNDVLQIGIGQGQNNAITDRQGRLIANFSLHRTKEYEAWILVESSQKDNLLNHLGNYHFREDIQAIIAGRPIRPQGNLGAHVKQLWNAGAPGTQLHV